MTNGFWQHVFDGFEEPTPLAFGLGDRTESTSTWKILVPPVASRDVLVAAWVLLQSRYSGESHITVGLQERVDSVAQALRVSIDEELTVCEFVDSIARQLNEQLVLHPITPTALRELLQWPTNVPLFNSSFAHTEEKGLMVCGEDKFSDKTLGDILSHFERLAIALEHDRGVQVKQVEHLGAEEQRTLLQEWNPSPTPYPESTVHALFEKQVAERASAVALVFGSRRLTYGELNAEANRLAHYLIGAGATPGQGVAIFLDRGIEQMVATLAILKAGAAYIPLDIEFPPERIVQMLEDARPPVILSHSSVAGQLPDLGESRVLKLDEIAGEVATRAASNPAVECEPDSLAYIMYTSGSTGRPKGVEVMHRGIVRLVFGVDYIPYNADTVILHIATVSFDATTFEIWGSLLHGGTCVVCPSRVPTLDMLGRLLEEHHVNTLLMTAAFFNLAIKESPQILRPLKYLLAGGEALSSWHVAEALRTLPDVRLVNAYGPTENSVISTTHVFDRAIFDAARPIPIGRAIGNSSCYVLDRFLRPVPVGVPGELYVGGDGVARGYANRPELTAERFLDDPFSTKPGARMYRTGDMVYWNREGLIEFIGRADNQIKLRGFRIELQEIEAVLAGFPGVEQAVAVVYEDDQRGKWLAAYVKVADPAAFHLDGLAKHAAEKMPGYMVPSALVPVAQWSFTPSGKLDRKALPKPDLAALAGTEFHPAETPTQKTLVELWQALLDVERIGIDESFFDLGGDSLQGVHLFHEIHRRFGSELPLASLTRHPTIRGLAAMIDKAPGTSQLEGFRSLQILQEGSPDLIPLFLVHGGQGNVLVFNGFVKSLDPRQPVYAFQWSGWDGRRGDSSILAMARAYKNELSKIHPEGPLRIGGYCVGSLIAIELVRMLEREGREIAHPLLVWDSPNLESKHYRRDEPWDSSATIAAFNRMKQALESIRLETTVDPSRVPASDYAPATGKAALIRKVPGLVPLLRFGKNAKEYLKTVPTRASIFTTYALRRPLPMNLRAQYCLWAMVAAAKRHKSSKCACDVLYFRSDCVVGRYFGLTGWWDDPFLGFAELCEGRFEAYAIGGGHTDVLDIPEMSAIVNRTFEASP